MKKVLITVLVVFFILITMLAIMLKVAMENEKVVTNFNAEYEQYLGKTLYGTDVTSLINKAIDNNEKNKIQKDENGLYIDDGKTSIKIELNMITVEKTFQMEQIYNADIIEFVSNFNLINFKCTNIEYHNSTKRVSKLVFEQLEK